MLTDTNTVRIGQHYKINASTYEITELGPNFKGRMVAGRGKIGSVYGLKNVMWSATLVREAPAANAPKSAAAAATDDARAAMSKLQAIDPTMTADWTNMCLTAIGSELRHGQRINIFGQVGTIIGFDPRDNKGMPLKVKKENHRGEGWHRFPLEGIVTARAL